MNGITILTGSPGTGKTTVAASLAAASDRGVHLATDRFYEFLAHRLDPTTPEAHQQNEAVVRAFMRSAVALAEAGYEVIVDGVVGPWMLPVVREECALPLHYIVLRADLDTVLARAAVRTDQPEATPAIVEAMHAQFAELDAYERNVVETAGRSLDHVVSEILEPRTVGAFRIRP